MAVASERFASLLDAEGIAGERVWSGLASLIGLSVGTLPAENRTILETPTLTSVGAQKENASGTVERIAHPAEAFGIFLRRAAAHRPTLVIVDDLQWADPESVRALDALLVSDPQIPLFVLGVARPEIEAVYPELFAHRGLTTLNLEPLPKRAAGELVRSAMGASASEELVEEIVGRAAGNAFFLEELIRYAAAGGRGFPDSVLGIVQARLDALPSEARRILRAASVFGEVAWQGGVGALVGESSLNFGVAHWLNDLVSQELLTEHAASRIPGEREVRFRHAIVRDAVYATLVDDERKTAHSAAGRWLESVNFDDPSVLARHSREGGEGVRAMKWLLAAAKKRLGGRG